MDRLGVDVIRPLALLSMLLLAPVATADVSFSLSGFDTLDEADVQAQSSIVHVEGQHSLHMELRGELVGGIHHTTTRYDVGAANYDSHLHCDPTELLDSVTSGRSRACSTKVHLAPLADMALVGTALAEDYYLRVFNLQGSPMDVQGFANAQATAHAQIYASGGIVPSEVGPHDPGQGDPITPTREGELDDLPRFSTQDPYGPQILTKMASGSERITVAGDFIIEILGPELMVGAPNSRATGYETGMLEGDLGVDDEMLFMRLVVQDANLILEPDTGAVVDFVTTQISVGSSEGALDLYGAAVTLPNAIRISSEAQRIEGPYEAAFAPQQDGSGQVQFAASSTPVAEPWTDRAMNATWFWWAAGIMFILTIAAVAIRQSTTPPLPRIESAIEDGSFRKAARMSSRVIRRDPGHESAQLARAIAWSQMGAHERIVRNLEPFLRRHEPSDGTLHYVYGLALHERGMDDAAREAMRSAVQRTPSLLPDVDAQLRPTAQTEGYS